MLAPARSPVQHPPPDAWRRPPGGDGERWRRVRRIAVTAALLVMVPVLVSLGQALAAPSNSSVGIRAVEWMRDNGARGIVNTVENLYYSMTAPAKGGPALHRLPGQAGVAVSIAPHHVDYYRPPDIPPLVQPGLPGEGVWRATYAGGGSRPPVLITSYRPDPTDYPRLVAGVAWIDHTRTSTALVPGISEPAVSLPSRGPEEVPQSLRQGLVATFNSGFKLKDATGGFAFHGHTYAALQPDMATIVGYANGRVNIVGWHGGPDAPPNVVFARQNLPLIVNHGRPNPNLNDGPEWGFTLGNKALVWRSGVGIDARGNLIYVAGPDLGLHSLANVMIHAGAVRAMELDINTYWTSFIAYRYPGAHGAANLLESMVRSPLRYLTPDDRDFFAVYLR